MPPLGQHQSGKTTKLLLLGDSGAGKTGALASLAVAGYNLRIMDFDNGIDPLFNFLTHPSSPYVKQDPNAASRVVYKTLTNEMKNVNGRMVAVKADAWQNGTKLLADWTDGDIKLGSITTWGEQDILVIDSLSLMCEAAMDFVLQMNARLGQQPHQSDWGEAQRLVKGLLKALYSEQVKCNVIVNCHIVMQGKDGEARGLPASLGKALSPEIGRFFNAALLMRSTGQGSAVKHKLHTRTNGIVELKNPSPMSVLPEYPIETGLADYFKAVRAKAP